MQSLTSKRRVTIVISNLSGGGAERVACNLANYLSKKSFQVEVITTLSNKGDTYRLADGIKKIKLMEDYEKKGKIYNVYTKISRLKRYVKDNQDVACYVVMLPINILLMLGLMKHTRSKMIFAERNNPSSYSFWERIIMKRGAEKADGFVVQTRNIYDYYGEVGNKVIIPNAINPDAIALRGKSSAKKIVAVGRLAIQKNYPMLIKAFNLFSIVHPEYLLEIYGQGSEKQKLEKMVDELGLTEKIKFKGYVEDVASQISNAACFAMASNYEGMPNALIEAMCMGIPCVVTDCDGGGAKELVDNMRNGILVEKNDIVGMSEGMRQIVEDGRLSEEISMNATKLRDKLASDKIYGKWREFIEEIIT